MSNNKPSNPNNPAHRACKSEMLRIKELEERVGANEGAHSAVDSMFNWLCPKVFQQIDRLKTRIKALEKETAQQRIKREGFIKAEPPEEL